MRAFGRSLAAVAVAGLAIRLVHVLAVTPDLRGIGDSGYYHDIANLLAGGHGFSDPFAFQAEGREQPTALHPPLFPLLLVLPSLVGLDSYLAHRATVALMGAATIVAVGLLARRVGGERVGLLAAALAAAYPVLISADGAVMSETLFGLLVVLALLAAYGFRDHPKWQRAIHLGGIVGLAALTRGEALILLPLVVVPLCLRAPRRAVTLVAATAACAAVILPWTVRNLTTFDRVVPISTNEGSTLAGANCDAVYRGRDIGGWEIRCVPPIPGEESVQAARFRREGLEYALDHAGRLPVAMGARVLRSFGLLQPLRHARNAEGRAETMEVLGAFAFYPVALLGVAGAVVLRRRRAPLYLLLAPVAVTAIVTALGYGVPRFRHPADLALVVLAATAIDALLRRREGSAERPGPGDQARAPVPRRPLPGPSR
jgi:hypothetical protein